MNRSALFLFAITICVNVEQGESNAFVTDPDGSKVVEFTWRKPYCIIHNATDDIRKIFGKFSKKFSVVSAEALLKIEVSCGTKQRHGFIYPGTFWCGRGTRAHHYSQLGIHREEDKCCREHDHCPNFLAAGECRGKTCSTSSYTTSHCDCDKKFQECLRNTGTETGNTIGAIFFNVAQLLCLRETKNCTETECPLEFVMADRYVPSEPFFTWRNSKAFVVNLLLKKFNILK